ncbi:MAG: hypothetical protein J6X79_06295 [Bacteroidales bacterium]|nr:hypothetical protein [Bacteroidales bacterium]
MKTKRAFLWLATMLLSISLLACDDDSVLPGGGSDSPDNPGDPSNPTAVEWVDLGLPSGLKWASQNVGANRPEDYGNYYAWGETTTKSTYTDANYRFGSYGAYTKYCYSGWGLNGFFDNKTTLDPADDAATANMGDGARTPTYAEWQELISHTTSTWTTRNGVKGRLFTAQNGKSIFLPAAGYKRDALAADGQGGWYSSSSLTPIEEDNPAYIWHFFFNSSSQDIGGGGRTDGFSVRAVRPSNPPAEEWVDLGLPSGRLWASHNVGATTPEGYGNYYAWGETTPKSTYTDANYRFGSYGAYTKYCYSGWGLNGFFDNKTTLDPADDAATANMGDGARTPTYEEWQELLSHTTSTWTTRNGVYGRQLTASNGKSIFLPAAGYKRDALAADRQGGWYSSSSLTPIEEDNPAYIWHFFFNSSSQDIGGGGRTDGFSVRAVK